MLQQTVFLGLSMKTNISICRSCFLSAFLSHNTGLKYSQPVHMRAKAYPGFHTEGLKEIYCLEAELEVLVQKRNILQSTMMHCALFACVFLGNQYCYCDMASHMLHKGLHIMNRNRDGIQSVYWQWSITLPHRALLQK